MPLPDDFHRECLYDADHWFVHDLLHMDSDAQTLVARTDTTRLGSLVHAQRPLPAHPKHFPGAVAIQITGTLGILHAAYMLGLRPSEGWVGFGTTIKSARFRRLGDIGPPVTTTLTCTRRRRLRAVWHLEYRFRFEQEGEVIYESEQAAAWTHGEAPTAPPET